MEKARQTNNPGRLERRRESTKSKKAESSILAQNNAREPEFPLPSVSSRQHHT
jgi:hypothetical protein